MPDQNITLTPDGDNQDIPQLAEGYYSNWRNLWAKNATLQGKRKNPLILFHGDKDPAKTHQDPAYPTDPGKTLPGTVGDTIVLPDPSLKNAGGTVDSHNPFTTDSDKVFLRLRILDDQFQPLKDATYALYVDGVKYPKDKAEGAFEPGGLINVEVRKTSHVGKLVIKYPPPPEAPDSGTTSPSAPSSPKPSGTTPSTTTPQKPPPVELQLWLQIGRLDPIQEQAPDDKCLAGVQQRLNNLGFEAGEVNGIDGDEVQGAIRRFQRRCGLTVDGTPSAGLQAELNKIHDKPGVPAAPKKEAEGGSGPSQKTAQTGSGSSSSSSSSPSSTTSADTIVIKGKEKAHAKAIEVLTAILKAANLKEATVTSGNRTPEEQARVMYNNLVGTGKNQGVTAQRKLYGSNGNKVIDAYVINRNRPKDEVIQAMKAKIEEVGPANVSAHCGTGAIDVDPASIKDHEAFAKAARANADVKRLLTPEDNSDPAFHLEIPQS